MNFKKWYLLKEVAQAGYDIIQQKQMFGPVYHGTEEDSLSKILQQGFSVPVGQARTGDIKHGYQIGDYSGGIPAPVHHLGYGVYFTTVINIAKQFQGSGRGLKQFYLDVPRLEVINFGSPNTMMKWWRSNGYDMPPLSTLKDKSEAQKEETRVQSTINMTNVLKSKFDAVYFKGKGLRRLLDGDQICVFDPNRVYLFNPLLNPENEFMTGDRVKIKDLPIAAVITGSRPSRGMWHNPFDILFNQKSNNDFSVKLSPAQRDKIKEKYRDVIYDTMLNHPSFKDFVNTRVQNSGNPPETTIANYVDDVFFQNLSRMIPESLIEKKVAKGQRI